MQGGREGIDRTRLNAGVWRSATAPHCKGRVSIVMLRAVLYCRQCRQAGWALCSGSWQRMVTTPRSDLSRHTTPLADKRKSQWPRCVPGQTARYPLPPRPTIPPRVSKHVSCPRLLDTVHLITAAVGTCDTLRHRRARAPSLCGEQGWWVETRDLSLLS